jgi:hypothetical protein
MSRAALHAQAAAGARAVPPASWQAVSAGSAAASARAATGAGVRPPAALEALALAAAASEAVAQEAATTPTAALHAQPLAGRLTLSLGCPRVERA